MPVTKIKVTYEHQLNFGTAEKPIYKTDGDIVECEKAIAENLVNGGYAVFVKSNKKEDDQ